MIISSMTKNGAILALFALLTTGAVGIIHNLTADSIAEQERKQLSLQLQDVLAPNFYLVINHKPFIVLARVANLLL